MILDGGGGSIGTLTIHPINNVQVQSNITIGTSFVVDGTANNNAVMLYTLDGQVKTITLNGTSSINWAGIAGLIFTNSPTANNSFDFGGNGGIIINGPSGGGGGGRIIGG
jgi:hypothetical protein